MKNFKFTLLVIILLAAIPTLFYVHVKHESPTPREVNQKAYEGNEDEAASKEKNYITVLTVSIAH